MSEPLIELREISKTFRSWNRRVNALDSVTLTVRRGDVFGLLGANGAGKTTAMRCILGLTRINSGVLRLMGRDRFERRSFFRLAAYLPEEPQLYQGATAREHLRYFGRLCDMSGGKMRARIAEVLEIIGLTDAADRPISTYSKGMKQRIGIGAAILHHPQIIFLDEPTRGLDPIGRREVRQLLQNLAEQGVTLFLNSHLLGEVERLCNRVAILAQWHLRVEGLLAELLTEKEGLEIRFALPEGTDAAAVFAAQRADGGLWKITVADTAVLAETAGRIALLGGRVVTAQAARMNLEDYFVRVLEEGDSA